MSQCDPKKRISEIRANLKCIPSASLTTKKEEIHSNSLQYINEFFRTQIGHFVQVDCFIGSGEIISKYGYLIQVGLDYIILQDTDTPNITSIDFWSIKFMYVYYDVEKIEKITPLM